jgi:hypothetical protein
MIRERAFLAEADRPALLAQLPANAALPEMTTWLWDSYDAALVEEDRWRQRLVHLAQQVEVVQRVHVCSDKVSRRS